MGTANITSLRKDAISLLETFPEEKLTILVQLMRDMNPAPKRVRSENSEAFKRLEQLRRPIPDLDEERELAEWREEKFGNAGFD